jgi:hypothetical protein
MANGIDKGGDYVSSKIKDQETIEIPLQQKMGYQFAKAAASHTLTVAASNLKDLFKPVVDKTNEVKKDVNQKIDKSNNECNLGAQLKISFVDWKKDSCGFLGCFCKCTLGIRRCFILNRRLAR